MACSLTVKYKIQRAMWETIVVDPCPVIIVNNEAISRNGFLNELTCMLVISLGTRFGFSRKKGKRSNPLLCFSRNCLQSSPLNVNVGFDNFSIWRKTLGDKET
jgi:hypothetical protein